MNPVAQGFLYASAMAAAIGIAMSLVSMFTGWTLSRDAEWFRRGLIIETVLLFVVGCVIEAVA